MFAHYIRALLLIYPDYSNA